VVTLSSHGYGPLGQSPPVIQAPKHPLPGLKVTLHIALPESELAKRLDFDIVLQPPQVDIELIQANGQTTCLPSDYGDR